MKESGLGKVYKDKDIIVKQGDEGNCMYVVQEGEVELLRELEGKNVHLLILGKGDFFGEVPFFERGKGMQNTIRATVKALGDVRVLTVDRKTLLRRIHEDPSLAYRILQVMSRRMTEMEDEIMRLVVNS